VKDPNGTASPWGSVPFAVVGTAGSPESQPVWAVAFSLADQPRDLKRMVSRCRKVRECGRLVDALGAQLPSHACRERLMEHRIIGDRRGGYRRRERGRVRRGAKEGVAGWVTSG
jgi:hypothetical protein